MPVIATAGVDTVIRRDDALKEQILRPMFGDEWPLERTFPTRTVPDGETIDLGGAGFTVLDLGPSESPHDSIWLLGDDRRTVFAGDQAYDRMHAYLADGFHEEWARPTSKSCATSCLRSYPAHRPRRPGNAGTARLATGVRRDLPRRRSLRPTGHSRRTPGATVVDRMTSFLPADEHRFLMEPEHRARRHEARDRAARLAYVATHTITAHIVVGDAARPLVFGRSSGPRSAAASRCRAAS